MLRSELCLGSRRTLAHVDAHQFTSGTRRPAHLLDLADLVGDTPRPSPPTASSSAMVRKNLVARYKVAFLPALLLSPRTPLLPTVPTRSI